ncbi:rod shape-determining protein MreC [Erythrobacteraceae bacterium CFH 75059]|uniref:rod shape-determining protein MreC n=1 Tax=Qipengyuania thermophila TaxID=2509361 RepID=UPI001021708B|nr:rod shape-determining protein MreC [Qipengyuania thermophila]TCD05144.1 rod shape-determining protein MreC [Erythrobacteraceae bacterium CFH 75059]
MSLFTGYALTVVGALLGAALILASLLRPLLFADARGIATDAISPLTGVVATMRTGVLAVADAVSGYYAAGTQNARLRREVEIARIRLAEAEAVRSENARLRSLIALRESEAPPIAITRMIGSTAASVRRFGFIGVGADQGVEPGMAVRTARGLLGRVLETGRDSARVLLLTDTESAVPVRLVTGEGTAMAQGRGDSLLRIRLINLGLNPLKRGDVFVTSGAGGYFTPGIAVAIVETVTDDGALARVISDPAVSDFVAVQPIFKPEAASALAEVEAPVAGD